jgi:methyl-accepting chemotaxis protein
MNFFRRATTAPDHQDDNNQTTEQSAQSQTSESVGAEYVEKDALLNAFDRSQAVISFTPDGTILQANDNFLNAVGYRRDEIQGQHHRMFVDNEYARSDEYTAFWNRLANGEFFTAEYKRFKKNGDPIWIQASYNPVMNDQGQVTKVVKLASDITDQKMLQLDHQGQIEAINRAYATIEFEPDGTILTANDHFLNAVGYNLDEVQGKHHRIFVDNNYAQSGEYQEFWDRLAKGEFFTAEYKRFKKNGDPIWIQASYNPILDEQGNTYKIVKFAQDITDRVQARHRAEELSDQTVGNVETAAAAAEEMHSAIKEITTNMSRSKTKVDDIVEKTEESERLSNTLAEKATSMEGVITMIRDIAEKTNLLALNATIEAARAGEAGKGFAVVANEVKTLAGQTNDATDKVMSEIKEIQSTVDQVTDSSSGISTAIGEISEYITSLSSAIEEQTSATDEISSMMDRVHQGIGELNTCVEEVSKKG